MILMFAANMEDALDENNEDGSCIEAALQAYDRWVESHKGEGDKLRADMMRLMHTLSAKLHACASTLQNPDIQQLGTLGGIQGAVDSLNKIMDAHATWASRLSGQYQPVAGVQHKAALHLVRVRTHESLELDGLRTCHSDAERVVKLGDSPDEDVLGKMETALKMLLDADEKVIDAKYQLEKDRRLKRDDTASKNALYTASKNALYEAKQQVLEHEKELGELWKDVYTIASHAYPDLPSRAIELAKKNDHSDLRYLSYLDARSASLLAPARNLTMYDDLDMISSATQQQSRHNVYSARYGERRVCLKQFDLGPVTDTLPEEVRKFQRELVGVSRLAHDHLIRAHLFFIEVDKCNRMNAYVEYSYYPQGDMHKWIQSLHPDAPRIKIVLLDALRGLEHREFLRHVSCPHMSCAPVCYFRHLS
jgi:hypothetical protein